jgi:uncharacterized protein (DUF2344 family)
MAGKGVAPNPAPPTLCKVRVRFAKRGRLRFSSHRDVARAFERAVRRAGLPVARSHGFSPHPRLSWVGAAPTGTASEAEYLEIGLTTSAPPERMAADLDEALPIGLDILAAVRTVPGRADQRQSVADRAAPGAAGGSGGRRDRVPGGGIGHRRALHEERPETG